MLRRMAENSIDETTAFSVYSSTTMNSTESERKSRVTSHPLPEREKKKYIIKTIASQATVLATGRI